jgi:hypothetical protein
MIPDQVLDKVLSDEDENKEVVRLAYEIAFEDRLKEPNESSLGFIGKRIEELRELFCGNE